ncbi:MAG: glutamate mutase L [Bacillota bacterium]
MAKPGKARRRVMVGSIGDCVHSLGVESFAEWMEDLGLGYAAVKLGPAVPVEDLVNKLREARPEVVGVSTRLGDLHVDKLVAELIIACHRHGLDPGTSGIRYCFGGLRPAANLVRAMTGRPVLPDRFSPEAERHFDLEAVAARYAQDPRFYGFFELVVDDYVTMEELEDFARRRPGHDETTVGFSDDLLARISEVAQRENRPILRAHIGIAAESVEPTIRDVEMVADAGALEIVSLGPDQPCQAHLAKFIRGEEDPEKYLRGQGGVPIRTREDLMRLKEACRRGNHPMIRIYSGTDELLALAEIFEETLHMPFPAVPIFFYNQMDGRGPLPIREGIDEHFEVMRWWARRGKPLEVNDPHQWQLRNCSDDMYVTDHLVAAVVALKCGIRHYIMQLMFDLPPQISPLADLAKMRAAWELIEPLSRHFDFHIIKETRGGLSSFPPNLNMAKGHLAISTHWQLYMDPAIVHVVSFPEAHHEAKGPDIIESCDIVKQVIRDFRRGAQPDVFADPALVARKEELKRGAMYNLLHLALLGGYEGRVTPSTFPLWAVAPAESAARPDVDQRDMNYETLLLELVDEANYPTGTVAMLSADTLDLALQTGLFQAPKLTVIDKRYELVGKCRTRMLDGCCRVSEFDGRPVESELERVDLVRQRFPWYFHKSVSVADDVSHITELAEQVSPRTIRAYRRRLGLSSVEGKNVLVVDFGSTFTKVGTFNTRELEFGLRYVPTTPDDLREGLADGLGVLEQCRAAGHWGPLEEAVARYDLRLPCSSAKGGLKLVTVSLVAEESGYAADLAALAAGAKLLASYSGALTQETAHRIFTEDCPELILMAGGVDRGGDTSTQLENARQLARAAPLAKYARYGVPVIYAGNQDVSRQIQAIFRQAGVDCRMAPNVMPEVNTFNIESVNECIRDVFQTIIIRGKGFDVVEQYMSAPFIPTPRAAFLGINLLSRGYGKVPGLGNLIALDIGGCTTDFYCHVRDNPLYAYEGTDGRKRVKRTILKTPNVPLAYRRVEGKYGLSYNAENLLEMEHVSSGVLGHRLQDEFAARFPGAQPRGGWARFWEDGRFDLASYLRWLTAHPHHLAGSEEEQWIHAHLAREILAIATRNNLGRVVETDTYFLQYGVNCRSGDCSTVLIGGSIYHKCQSGHAHDYEHLGIIARGAMYDGREPYVLRPSGRVWLDAGYLVTIVGGLYGRVDPERALLLVKAYLRTLEAESPAAGS